jgi:hypothetical protein
MDEELSRWYGEQKEQLRRESWKIALLGCFFAGFVVTIGALIVQALLDPHFRRATLLILVTILLIVAVRYAALAYGMHRLKLRAAKRAMLR